LKAENKRARPARGQDSSASTSGIEDAILREVHEIRDSYAREHGYDLDRIVQDLKDRDRVRRSALLED
jgi:hypothetical protein